MPQEPCLVTKTSRECKLATPQSKHELPLSFWFLPVADDVSVGGTYRGKEIMGLLWSMRPVPGSRTGLRYIQQRQSTSPLDPPPRSLQRFPHLLAGCASATCAPPCSSPSPCTAATSATTSEADALWPRSSPRGGTWPRGSAGWSSRTEAYEGPSSSRQVGTLSNRETPKWDQRVTVDG